MTDPKELEQETTSGGNDDQILSTVEDIEEKIDEFDKHQLKTNIKSLNNDEKIIDYVKRTNRNMAICGGAVLGTMIGGNIIDKVWFRNSTPTTSQEQKDLKIIVENGCNTCSQSRNVATDQPQQDVAQIFKGLEDTKIGLVKEFEKRDEENQELIDHLNTENKLAFSHIKDNRSDIDELKGKLTSVEEKLGSFKQINESDLLIKSHNDSSDLIKKSEGHMEAKIAGAVEKLEKEIKNIKDVIIHVQNSLAGADKRRLLGDTRLKTDVQTNYQRTTNVRNQLNEAKRQLEHKLTKLQSEFDIYKQSFRGEYTARNNKVDEEINKLKLLLNSRNTEIKNQIEREIKKELEGLEENISASRKVAEGLVNGLKTELSDEIKNKVKEFTAQVTNLEDKFKEGVSVDEFKQLKNQTEQIKKDKDQLVQQFNAWMKLFNSKHSTQEQQIQHLLKTNSDLEELLAVWSGLKQGTLRLNTFSEATHTLVGFDANGQRINLSN